MKTKFYLPVIVLLIIGSISKSADGWTTETDLKGIITDSVTEEPIFGTTIYIEELDRGVVADSKGIFVISELKAGLYTLTIQSLGYQALSMEIRHPEDGYLEIELTPDIIYSDDVIVTSSPLGRNIHYQPAQSINAEKLQRNAAPSLGEILDGNPPSRRWISGNRTNTGYYIFR